MKDTQFYQANKKDAFKVTEGKYTMSTTKKGRFIHRSAPYDVQLKKLWRIGRECGRLTVNYRMGHSLEEMGVPLRPTDWSRVIVRKSSSSPSNSPSTSPVATPVASPKQKDDRSSRSSSPPSPVDPVSLVDTETTKVIRFTSTEIKQEIDTIEPTATHISVIAIN